MNWNAISAIATAVYAAFTIGLVVTAIVAIRVAKKQLNQFHRQNQVDHLENQIKQFESEPMTTFRAALAKHRIDASGKTLKRLSPDESCPELDDILSFFEHMALLEKQNYLDLFGIWHTFGYWIFAYHADARDYIEQERREDATFFEDFCQLVEKLREIEIAKRGNWYMPSEDKRFDFYEVDCRRPSGSPPIKSRKRSKK
jgi:hypothetical protein